MRRFFHWIFVYLLIGFSPLTTACELSVRTFEFAPFALKDEYGQWNGIDMEYTKVLLEDVGCSYKFVEVPWARGLEMLRLGQIDMMLNVTKTDERAKSYHFVGPQRLEILRFVSVKDDVSTVADWDQLASVKGSLMRQRGTFIGKRFNQMLEQHPEVKTRLVYLPNTVTRIDFLRKGRAVGFFAEQSFLLNEFNKNPDYGILKLHPIIINKAPVYYAFSKASLTAEQMVKIRKSYDKLHRMRKIQQVEGQYELY